MNINEEIDKGWQDMHEAIVAYVNAMGEPNDAARIAAYNEFIDENWLAAKLSGPYWKGVRNCCMMERIN